MVLVGYTKKMCDMCKTAILTMAVATVMWGSSANGDECLWVTTL